MAKKNAGGRPTKFSKSLADTICTAVMEGYSIRHICRDEKMPARSSVYKWLAENTEFSDQYAKAAAVRADELFDEMFDIADDGSNDFYGKGDNPDEPDYFEYRGEHVTRSRLRVDTRKWALSKMMPKKYGDKLGLEHEFGEQASQIMTALASGRGRAGKRQKPKS